MAVRRRLLKHALLLSAVLVLMLPGASLLAQEAYKYRDANGQWVFTDRAVNSVVPAGDAISRVREPEALHIAVERTDTADLTQLIGVNNCRCVVTLQVSIVQSDLPDLPEGASYQATLEPGARQTLVEARHPSGAKTDLQFRWKSASDRRTRYTPHRAPIAHPSPWAPLLPSRRLTRPVLPMSPLTVSTRWILRYRMGLRCMPRARRTINVRHDSFRGAALPALLDQRQCR